MKYIIVPLSGNAKNRRKKCLDNRGCTQYSAVEAMEFPGGLQTKENITDGHNSDSELVCFLHRKTVSSGN